MVEWKKAETTTDAQGLADLAQEIWREHYTSIIGSRQVDYMLDRFQSTDRIYQDIQEGKVYLLVQSDAENVGYVSYHLLPNQLFLSKFYMKKSIRGQGAGRQLFDELKRIATAEKKLRILLTVNKDNTRSLGVYQALGFSIVKEQVTDIGNGFVMDDYVMEYRFS